MDAASLQAMNAYLQSIAGSTGIQQGVTVSSTTNVVPQLNPLEQYYQNQYAAALNSNLVNQQFLNLLIQSRNQIPTSTVPDPVGHLNSVYPGIFDPSGFLVLSQNPQHQMQNQQIQMLAMKLNGQTNQIQSQVLPATVFPRDRRPQAFQISTTRTSMSPNSDSDSINSNGFNRKRRHREETQTQVKQSYSQGGSPVNVEVNGTSPQIRNRSYTCPEGLKSKKELFEPDSNKQFSTVNQKSEIDPGSPQRHHPDNLPKLNEDVKLMEGFAAIYALNAIGLASSSDSVPRKKMDKRYRPIWDSSRENSPEPEYNTAPNASESSASPISIVEESRKPPVNVPIADLHRVLENVLNTTQV